jgi:hypothetical protein
LFYCIAFVVEYGSAIANPAELPGRAAAVFISVIRIVPSLFTVTCFSQPGFGLHFFHHHFTKAIGIFKTELNRRIIVPVKMFSSRTMDCNYCGRRGLNHLWFPIRYMFFILIFNFFYKLSKS